MKHDQIQVDLYISRCANRSSVKEVSIIKLSLLPILGILSHYIIGAFIEIVVFMNYTVYTISSMKIGCEIAFRFVNSYYGTYCLHVQVNFAT